jgi:hypothetical protein
MRRTIREKHIEAQDIPATVVLELALRVIDNPRFAEDNLQTLDVCKYIEKLANELMKTAMKADQELLAYLLGSAAQEARFQAGRIHLDR